MSIDTSRSGISYFPGRETKLKSLLREILMWLETYDELEDLKARIREELDR